MISLSHSPWRIASLAVVLGLLGSCAAVLVLGDAPKGPPRARGGSRLATATREGLRMAAPSPATRAGLGRTNPGLQLMSEAAAASEKVSYGGVQIVVWWGQDGTSASFVQVWHRPGSTDLAEAPAATALPSPARQSGQAQDRDQGGILVVSRQMLALMEANYQIGYTGRGTADSRSADVVELRRPDGSLAARFWLDAATKLPLRRELYDSRSAMISENAFIDLDIGEPAARMPAAAVQPWTEQLDSAKLDALRDEGWPLPAVLAGNLSLFRASQTSTQDGPVVDLCYSDGLSVVSLFLQRGQLPLQLSGWQHIAAGGQSVFSAGPDARSLAWSADGFVLTVIADAAPATISQVVAELPHDGHVGFWERMARGFRRLASWANPFG